MKLLLPWILLLTLGILTTTQVPARSSQAMSSCSAPANEIMLENCLPGTPASEWDIDPFAQSGIEGFAADISVNRGQSIDFKVNTSSSDYKVEIFRMGYYGGLGARRVATIQPSASLPQPQPPCLTVMATGLVDCGNWEVSASWAVPASAVSGVYVARLTREDEAGANHIMFIVRDDTGGSDLLFQTSDTTWHAYNDYGGNSFYTGAPAGRAYKVSYNRPFNTRRLYNGGRESFFFSAEYPMLRWIESNGYDVSYFTGVDSDRRGGQISSHRVFLSIGHDEYWSSAQRSHVEAAGDAGTHLAFFSGNDVFWKTRWETSIDGSGTLYRTLVSYKETQANAKIDPSAEWTGTWRDPRFSPPADGGRPENSLTGTIFTVNGPRYDAIVVPAADGQMRFWRNTSIANLAAGQSAALPANTLGYEWNSDLDNGSRPAGQIRMSSTTVSGVPLIQDYGSTYASGTATHHLTLHRRASGAFGFSAGTIQWSWGLDATHDGDGQLADPRMQQATVNLFADMGVQPGLLQPGLTQATASSDTTPPVATITAPQPGTSTPVGTPLVITGTASDSGGVVGGVEVSTDGGQTWHPASGRESWSYSWTPTTNGNATILSRASDDSANLGSPGAGVSVSVGNQTCPCSLWSTNPPPAAPADDTGSVELGVKFQSDVSGFITGLRFYKFAANTGSHRGSLWTTSGQLLASATFTNESASGWQQVSFASPVAISAGTTYVASYHAPNGGYAKSTNYFFASGLEFPPLRAPADAASGGNGVFAYGPAGSFPSGSFQASNYWVDVVFNITASDSAPPTVASTSPASGASLVAAGVVVRASFSEALNPATVGASTFTLSGPAGAVAGSVSYDPASASASFTPASPLTLGASYTATLRGGAIAPRIADVAGNALASSVSWSFAVGCPCSLWGASAPPAVLADDTNAVELGVKFQSDVSGFITGLRFYKFAANTGSHRGSLWTASGQLVASAIFTNESASGWQQVSFATPVAISAGTTYVASYHAPNGGYAKSATYFASALVTAPLRALADAASGGNGVFAYGPAGSFPNGSFQASNYWVDILFEPAEIGQPVSTSTPTSTALPTSTSTALPTSTSTALPTSTSTALPTSTRTITALPLISTSTSTSTALPPTSTPTRTPTSTPVPANLITNAGFELDATNDTAPDSWTTTSRFTRSAALIRSGAYSGRHRATDNANYSVTQTVSAIVGGSPYTFSGWVNIPATSDSFTFSIQLRWRNDTRSNLRTDTVRSFSSTTAGWEQALGTFTAPNNANAVVVVMQLTSLNATVYVDDFSLER